MAHIPIIGRLLLWELLTLAASAVMAAVGVVGLVCGHTLSERAGPPGTGDFEQGMLRGFSDLVSSVSATVAIVGFLCFFVVLFAARTRIRNNAKHKKAQTADAA